MILKLSFVRSYGCLTVFLSALLPFAELAQAAESDSTVTPNAWTRFRGPNGSGRAASTELPVQWDTETGIKWKTELPGPGTSSPVVWEHRMYLTCHTGYGLSRSDPGSMDALKRHVLCLDRRTGNILWQRDIDGALPVEEYSNRMLWHGYASSTPVVDETGVYVFFGKEGVMAFDHDGERRWDAPVGNQTHGWGSAASPILHDNLVIVNACVESGKLIALDKTNGTKVWEIDGMRESWNTPLMLNSGRTSPQLLVANFGEVWSVHPETGDIRWKIPGIEYYIVPSLVTEENLLFSTGGRKREMIAFQLDELNPTRTPEVLWKLDKGSNVPTPIYVGGYLYWIQERLGILYCADAKSGDLLFEDRLQPSPGTLYASPIAANNLIYWVSRKAGTFVVRADSQFDLAAHNPPLDDSPFNATPAVVGDSLYLRSDKFVYCLQKKSP